jgi:hypothetical protein
VLLLALIVAVFVGLVAWCYVTAPNVLPRSPQRREREAAPGRCRRF